MTDPMDDLRQSSAEVSGVEVLSPAAQAVLNAAWDLSPVNCGSHKDRRRQQIAAALRALADHKQKPICVDQPIDHWTPSVWTRRELRNLAAELEGHHG